MSGQGSGQILTFVALLIGVIVPTADPMVLPALMLASSSRVSLGD